MSSFMSRVGQIVTARFVDLTNPQSQVRYTGEVIESHGRQGDIAHSLKLENDSIVLIYEDEITNAGAC